MTNLARLLFIAMGLPLAIVLIKRMRLQPKNFDGCGLFWNKYGYKYNLFARVIYSWWIMPLRIYDESITDRKTRFRA